MTSFHYLLIALAAASALHSTAGASPFALGRSSRSLLQAPEKTTTINLRWLATFGPEQSLSLQITYPPSTFACSFVFLTNGATTAVCRPILNVPNPFNYDSQLNRLTVKDPIRFNCFTDFFQSPESSCGVATLSGTARCAVPTRYSQQCTTRDNTDPEAPLKKNDVVGCSADPSDSTLVFMGCGATYTLAGITNGGVDVGVFSDVFKATAGK